MSFSKKNYLKIYLELKIDEIYTNTVWRYHPMICENRWVFPKAALAQQMCDIKGQWQARTSMICKKKGINKLFVIS